MDFLLSIEHIKPDYIKKIIFIYIYFSIQNKRIPSTAISADYTLSSEKFIQ